MSKKLCSLICFVLVLGLAGSALALDDLDPPFWRNGPGTMYAHWEFSTDPNLGPDPNQVEADEYMGYTTDHVDSLSLWYDEGPGTVTNAAMAWYGDANYVWYSNFQGRTGVIEPNLDGAEYLTLFVLNNWPADPNRNKRFRVQVVVYAETLDDYNLPVWTETATADGGADIYIPGPQQVAPPGYDPNDEEEPEYFMAYRLVEVVPLPGEPNWYHMTVELEFFDGAGEDSDATNPGAETFFLNYWYDEGEPAVGQHPFWIDEVIFDTICYDTNLEGWGPSNPSPVYDEDHVVPSASLSFQAPWNALCMNPDPNYDPNLTGPFEYDVYVGLEPNVLTMTKIYDACVPTNCNDVMTFDPCSGGDLADATVFYWKVDINDTDAINGAFYEGTYLKFRTWGFAGNVAPADESINVAPPVLLEWAPDGYATTCDVYFGTSFAEVNTATTSSGEWKANQAVSDPNYDAGMLDLSATYYWRIDEKNGGGAAIKGEVWSFTTGSYFVVDDFDSYVNQTSLWNVWDDWTTNSTGAAVFVEQDANYTQDGNSLRYDYDSTDKNGGTCVGSIASTDMTRLGFGSDWTASGIEALVLSFFGQAGNNPNSTSQLYLQLEDTSSVSGVVLYDDMNDVAEASWHEWNIDLSIIDTCGVDLSNIDRITIGFGGEIAGGDCSTKAGGTGTVWFDDIQLHPPRCRSEVIPWDIAEGDCNTDGLDLALMGEDWLTKDYQVFPVPPDRNNLLVEYLFDPCVAHQDLYDSSGNGRHGQPSGSLWSVANGYLTIEAAGGYVDIPFGASNPFHGPNDFSVVIEYRNSSTGNTALLTSTDPCIPMSWEDPNVEEMFALYSPMTLITMQSHSGGPSAPDDVNFVYDNFYKAGSDVGITVVGGIDSWHYVAATYDADGGICPAEPWDPNACPPGTVSGLVTVYLDAIKGPDPLVMDPNIPVDANYDIVRIGDGYTPLHGEDWGFGPHIGDINEVLIFDVALTEAEVYYLSGITGATYVPNTSLANIVPKSPPPTSYDPNDPDMVNFLDYDLLASHWLEGPILWP